MNFLVLLLFPMVYTNPVSPTPHVAEPVFDDKEIVKVSFDQSRSVDGGLSLSLESESRGIQQIELEKADSILSPNFAILDSHEEEDGTTSFFEITHTVNISQVDDEMYANHEHGTFLRIRGDNVQGLLTPNIHIRNLDDGYGSHEVRKIQWPDGRCKFVKTLDPLDDSIVSSYDSERMHVTINPEILVIVDAQASKQIKDNGFSEYDYLTIYWKAINHLYKTTQRNGLTVNIKLSGWYVVPSGSDIEKMFLTPYIINGDTMKIDGDKVLEAFAKSLYDFRYDLHYDVAYLLTARDIHDESAGANCLGIAYVSAACITDYEHKMEIRSGIGEDINGSFSGVLTTAHEVGHILGSDHDGYFNSSACEKTSGYIMNEYSGIGGRNNLHFSSCSAVSFKAYSRRSTSSCLSEYSAKQLYSLSKYLPGQLFNADKQCASYFSGAVKHKGYEGNSLCRFLLCQKGYTYLNPKQPALEGTYCGGGKMCRHGDCVA